MSESLSIPGPPPLPLIGNLRDIDLNNTIQSFTSLAKTYGPIFKLHLGGSERVFITNHELANEVLSRKDIVKKITGTTEHLAKLIPHGILTANHGQESWGLTRRTLNPAFTKASVKDMFPEVLDIVSQLVLKWARFGSGEPFDLQEEFTRLTMDTIALCAMGTRFNSFYREELHPFVQKFGEVFEELQRRSNRPEWYTSLMWEANKLHDENVQFIRSFCSDLVNQRKAEPTDKRDIFNALLKRRDPVTGKELSLDIITDNMITFLFAGKDTSLTLSPCAIVAVAVLFQNFDFKFADPDYELQYQPSLHRKAKDLHIYATLRPNVDIMSLHRDLFSPAP
ncbi:hypothetical protein E8E14_009804 [Neopestalotiopsis sp. 37M]|nr:hypothetical protein E8E14_009804 [Neopestalotiopsis sp. 37M]